jgi:hypothetical protein
MKILSLLMSLTIAFFLYLPSQAYSADSEINSELFEVIDGGNYFHVLVDQFADQNGRPLQGQGNLTKNNKSIAQGPCWIDRDDIEGSQHMTVYEVTVYGQRPQGSEKDNVVFDPSRPDGPSTSVDHGFFLQSIRPNILADNGWIPFDSTFDGTLNTTLLNPTTNTISDKNAFNDTYFEEYLSLVVEYACGRSNEKDKFVEQQTAVSEDALTVTNIVDCDRYGWYTGESRVELALSCTMVSDEERDSDQDGINDAADNCVFIFNPNQGDIDSDSLGDNCDADIDDDGVPNEEDPCPIFQGDGWQFSAADFKKFCYLDSDGDGIKDAEDNCPQHKNPNQEDNDGDGVGDACDSKGDSKAATKKTK